MEIKCVKNRERFNLKMLGMTAQQVYVLKTALAHLGLEAELTPDECQKLSYLNCLAFDIARKEAREADTRIPAFLCTSSEALAEYREKAFAVCTALFHPHTPFDEISVQYPMGHVLENLLSARIPETMLQKWIDVEAGLKTDRADNDLNAWFV